jgi:hypothetical protein
MKTLANSEDFTGSRTCLRKLSFDLIFLKYSPSQCHSHDGSPKRMGTLDSAFEKANSQLSAFFRVFYHHLLLLNSLQNHRRLPECRNKHFEEGFNKDLQN